MASSTRSRASTLSAGSLLQDVPGAFPKSSSDSNRPPASATSNDVSAPLSLSQAVHARRAEFVRPKHIRVKVGTWNVSASKGAEKDIGAWFVDGQGVTEALAGLKVGDDASERDDNLGQREDVAAQEARYARKQATAPRDDPGSVPGGKEIGLYVLGLQEVVDVNSVSEALRPYSDPGVANKWKGGVEAALPSGYRLVAEQQLIGMLLLVYASVEVAKDTKCVSTTSVGTGIAGYMGNKGAVTARIVLGETTRLAFIDCHLSAGADAASLDRRNWDAAQVVSRTRFEPIRDESMGIQQGTGETIGDEDVAFWMGDLNYRLEGIPGDDVRRLLMLHTRNEYDLSQRTADTLDSELASSTDDVKQHVQDRQTIGSGGLNTTDHVAPSEDPMSLQTTLSSLLPHDELHQQMRLRAAFHEGWREGPITFLPTYKYDIGSVGVFDSSDKKRAPSWCDRILYRTRRDRLAYAAKVREEIEAKRKDEEMSASGIAEAVGEDEGMLEEYDPETDGVDDEGVDGDEGVLVTKEGFEDGLELEYYVAHQRILSSDHKPLDAVFRLTYAAVDQDLKAKVHAEVVRELDKTENETRADVTVVVDPHYSGEAEQSDDDPAHFEGVWFGDVRWAQGKHRTLTIANTGRVAAAFTFIERPVSGAHQSSGVAPKWLNLDLNGVHVSSSSTSSAKHWLEPGESTTVELEIRIFDLTTVHDLNDGLIELDDILVLRVEGGRDHFVPLCGRWQDTSLGRSINKLVRIPEGGIRRLQRQSPGQDKRKSAGSDSARLSLEENSLPVCVSAPRELFRLTEAVEVVTAKVVQKHSADDEHSGGEDSESFRPWEGHHDWPFGESCWPECESETWREALGALNDAIDTDSELQPSLPETLPLLQRLGVLAQYLMLFLRSIPEGIVTEEVWYQIDAYFVDNERAKRKIPGEEEKMAIQELLHEAPAGHAVSFILVTSMLERMVQEMTTAAPSRVSMSSQQDDAVPPMSPKRPGVGALRRMTGLGRLPAAAPTDDLPDARGHALAKLFGGAMVRLPSGLGERNRPSVERRRERFVTMFLTTAAET